MQSEPRSRFASVNGLGQFNKLYPYNKSIILINLFNLGIGILLIGAFLGQFLFKLSQLNCIIFVSAITLIGITLIIWYDRHENWSIAAALYEGGFAYYDGYGLEKVRWEQIEKLEDDIREREFVKGMISWEDDDTHYYTVHTDSGLRIELASYKLYRSQELWAAIEAGVAEKVLPEAISAIESGKTLHYDPFMVDRHGLHHTENQKDAFIGWHEIQSIELKPKRLEPVFNQITVTSKEVYSQHKQTWASVMKHEVPDAHIFLALCKHFIRWDNQSPNIQAESFDRAAKMAQSCPFLMGGASISIIETFDVM